MYEFEYKYRYRFMFKWIAYVNSDKCIMDFLVKSGFKNIVVLAVDQIANLFIEDLLAYPAQCGIKIKGILTYKNISFPTIQKCDINNLDKDIDTIVIADPDYQKRIETYLKEKVQKSVNIINLEYMLDSLLSEK